MGKLEGGSGEALLVCVNAFACKSVYALVCACVWAHVLRLEACVCMHVCVYTCTADDKCDSYSKQTPHDFNEDLYHDQRYKNVFFNFIGSFFLELLNL